MEFLGTDIFSSMRGFSSNLVAFIVVIGVLVFIHEFGHYYVAIKNKVKVETFSIGFGPKLFGWQDKRGTLWQVCALPLGGYVKMFGDVDPTSIKTDGTVVAAMSPEEREQAFFSKSVGARAAIVAAGPGINFLFALILLIGLYVTIGKSYIEPRVGSFIEDSPAERQGIKVGDLIVSISGEQIHDFFDIRRVLSFKLGQEVLVTVNRDGEMVDIPVQPKVDEIENRIGMKHTVGILGVKPPSDALPRFEKLNPLQAVGAAFEDTWIMIKGTFIGIYQMIMGERSSKELGGVISIAKLSGDMSHSIASFIWFMAMLSANLGLVNLFPIPVLDGGHLVFYAAEAARGKPLSDMAQEYSLRFGLALVLSLMMFALWNDLNNFGVVSFFAKLF
jgi:regulator of sigma E protease